MDSLVDRAVGRGMPSYAALGGGAEDMGDIMGSGAGRSRAGTSAVKETG